MALYIVRIELHGIKEGTDARPIYDTLHSEMAKRGFRKSFTNKGVKFEMPSAEYLHTSGGGIKSVKLLASEAAALTNYDFGVWVTEARNVDFDGLVEVKK